ncbi:MAG: hemolysin secretion protein D [Bacteroidetes bacterium QS_1_65_9]|nr:MAG: hemolysin secretion protein D [Bacteroidetes bacterium QS_1_65_9]
MPADRPAPDDSSSDSLPPSRDRQWLRPTAEMDGSASLGRTSALQAAQSPAITRSVLIGSAVFLVVLGVALTFVPWRQTVSGTGEVTAYAPEARPRTVESQLQARVDEWYVVEGDEVAKGDTIAVLEDLGSSYLDDQFAERVAEQRTNTLSGLRLEVERARQKLAQARQKRRSAEEKVSNAALGISTARTRLSRIEDLQDDGISSVRDLETARLKFQKARTDSVAAAADLAAARRAVESARLNVERKERKLEAQQAKLNRKVDNAQERTSNAVVRAPIDGAVSSINRVGPGQTVKKGTTLATVAPETDDRAAELFVSSIGASLIEPGRQVQLQFSGFPALQFSGLPEASTGTFTGTVRFIDPVGDGSGRFRMLVVPDTSANAPSWPAPEYLRQGAPARGSVLLSNVSLGYEIWRRMNGLPPQLSTQQNTAPAK